MGGNCINKKHYLKAEEMLATSRLFEGIFLPEGAYVLQQIQRKQWYKEPDGLHFVLDGEMEVYSITPDGFEVCLTTLHQGDCFGISTLCTDANLQTSIKAVSNTCLITIQKDVFTTIMQSNPEVAIRYATICNEKIRFLLSRIALLTLPSARQRIASLLLTNNEMFHSMSCEKLASYLSMSRATWFREISYLKREKIIQVENTSYSILDKKHLINIVSNTKKEGIS